MGMKMLMMRQLCGSLVCAAPSAAGRPRVTTATAGSSVQRRWLSASASDVNGLKCAAPQRSSSTEEVPTNALLQSIARDAAALQNLHTFLSSDPAALAALETCTQHITECHARDKLVYVTGVGKSGVVAQRLASTLASISVRSQWIHGSEWVHGELGNLRNEDMVLILSHSGKTSELLPLPPLFQAAECAVVAITGAADSPLALKSDVAIVAPAEDQELCPVPSRSIVVQESICNAIVEHLVHRMGECAASFKCNHPGGSIGDQFSHNHASE